MIEKKTVVGIYEDEKQFYALKEAYSSQGYKFLKANVRNVNVPADGESYK